MLHHIHTIRRLTEAQKIRLLTDIQSLADPDLVALGVPLLRCGSARDVSGGGFPSPVELARAWDRELLADVAEAQCRSLVRIGKNHVFLPEAKPRLTPFGEGLSEDPVLAGELAGACLAGADRAGIAAGLSGYGFTPREEARLDTPVSPRIRHTFLDIPYEYAKAGGEQADLIIRTSGEALPAGSFRRILCLHAEGTDTVKVLNEGMICMSGSAPAVQVALHNYRRLASAIEHGKATTGELESAVASGEAVSEETLDMALDRLLDFAAECVARSGALAEDTADLSELRHRAVLSSVVLLENRRLAKTKRPILPLKKPKSVCLLGDMLSAGGHTPEEAVSLLTAAGCGSVTYAPGYTRGVDRDEALVNQAVETAKEADTVILLLGMDAGRERQAERDRRCTLPAAQLALFYEVSRLGKPVIVVISSRVSPDVSFLDSTANPPGAVLLAPLEEAEGLSAVMDVLMGQANPSGRLPVSLCAREHHPDLFREDRPVGPFLGYRYFDSMGCGAAYPFGHGLSYTSFRYSNLKVQNGEASFTVQNRGKQAGVETAQLYAGLSDSAVLRPKKELIGFARVALGPGEKKTVTLPIKLLPICDGEGRLLQEKGTYTLSVGASSEDIRLKADYEAGADILPADGLAAEDYLFSLSNIQSKQYLMEAEGLPMKPSLRNLLFGIAALCLAVSVKVYDVLSHTDSLFLDILACVLAIGAVVCFVQELVDRRRRRAEEDAYVTSSTVQLFHDPRTVLVPTAASLFDAEDELEREMTADAAEEDEALTDEYDLFADVDKDLTFGEAARELAVLAREKGISVSEATLRSVFAALAASRLAVVHNMDDTRFSALISLLGEYFACPTSVDLVDGNYRSETDALFTTDSTGARVPRHTLRAVIAARNEPGKIHIAAMGHVDPAGMSAYFVPFARHAHAPHSGRIVECHGGEGADATYTLSENLWFILNLKKGASVCQLPDHITEIATVNTWAFEVGGPVAGTHAEFRRFGYGQMDYLRDRLRSDFSADEDTWKKVDRLEAYAAGHSGFRMSNKLWLGMEMYMAALMSAGAEEPAARDEAMAVNLIPSLTASLNGRIPRDARGLSETLDAVFGEDQTALCRKAVKESGADLT